MFKDFQETFTFDDVLLVPKESDIKSRKEISIESDLGAGLVLKLPIISSPMDTITEREMAAVAAQYGGLGIIHRYNTIEEQVKHVKEAWSDDLSLDDINIGAAVGITNDFFERAIALVSAGANVICVDVAHGHHTSVKSAVKVLRSKLPASVHIMAGNVATAEGYEFLINAGADSVRIGVGGGSICSTRLQTGHGIPTLTSIIDCAKAKERVGGSLIADGGIKKNGDIVKAIAAGADAVMLGSMLSATDETPGDWIELDGQTFKKYRGMASEEAQVDWRGHASSREGVSSIVNRKGRVGDVFNSIDTAVRSGYSYTGARTTSLFHAKAQFVKQSQASTIESDTHIYRIGRK